VHKCHENNAICVLNLVLLYLLFSRVAILSSPKKPDLVPKKLNRGLNTYTHKTWIQAVTRLEGSRHKTQFWQPIFEHGFFHIEKHYIKVNACDIVGTYFEKCGHFLENSSSPLVSKAGYGPYYNLQRGCGQDGFPWRAGSCPRAVGCRPLIYNAATYYCVVRQNRFQSVEL